MSSNQYPEDEFDFQGKSLPVGSHRRPMPKWRVFFPFLIVLIVAPLAAWGVVFVMDKANQTSNVASTSTSSTSTSTDNKSNEAKKKAAEQEAKKKAEEAEKVAQEQARKAEEEKRKAEEEAKRQAEASIDYAIKVKVFNGTAKNGLAARVAERVKGQNFTNVSAGNNPGINASNTTVYYGSEGAKVAAEKIASSLGVSNVVLDSSAPGGDGIAVLVMQDFAE